MVVLVSGDYRVFFVDDEVHDLFVFAVGVLDWVNRIVGRCANGDLVVIVE